MAFAYSIGSRFIVITVHTCNKNGQAFQNTGKCPSSVFDLFSKKQPQNRI
ncbi:hypothetical protein FHS90_003355 [Rufibacter quisquiliarum]|uniref:Uncharacterized protein n=1 Tax=Rufibacter quisquiliarum TaxID=1549639 RepID=A0A839GT20_9BACT|nr:hypothetical protein [Rufibacter quisquiliarum]